VEKNRIKIGIRREDLNEWERRTPLVPEDVKELISKYPVEVVIEPSCTRVFSDEEYKEAGAVIHDDMNCRVIFAIKEIPEAFFTPSATYVFFSHTIKGQPQNMPMLKRILKLKCNLIDYEKVTDAQGKRLLFFGRFAGLAGMIDSLWAYGQRLRWEGIDNPFAGIKQSIKYRNLSDALDAVRYAGERINESGLHTSVSPLICGFAGYGNVGTGAQEIYDCLPVEELKPEELSETANLNKLSSRKVYKVVFREEHIVEPVDSRNKFQLNDYYSCPEKYRGVFEKYVPHLSILMNCIYWDRKYPRLITKQYLKSLYSSCENQKLKVIGDISCDIDGAIQCNLKYTDPGEPIYVYDPLTEKISMGYEGRGLAVLAVYNLPCELPVESSEYFSDILKQFVFQIAAADYSVKFEKLNLPSEIKNAVIAYQGELTPAYKYLERFL
jgi:alpha-aminoadipic semialdehyde synthase